MKITLALPAAIVAVCLLLGLIAATLDSLANGPDGGAERFALLEAE